MNAGIIVAVLVNLIFSSTMQEIFNYDIGVEIFWIWLNFTGVVITLVVAYLVSALSKNIEVKEGIPFQIKRSDIMQKETYILVGFFIVIVVFSYFVPDIFGL